MFRGQLRGILTMSEATFQVVLDLVLGVERILMDLVEVGKRALCPYYLIFSMQTLKLVEPTNHGVVSLFESAVIRQQLNDRCVVLAIEILES
jgi:hypothetical protein